MTGRVRYTDNKNSFVEAKPEEIRTRTRRQGQRSRLQNVYIKLLYKRSDKEERRRQNYVCWVDIYLANNPTNTVAIYRINILIFITQGVLYRVEFRLGA